MCFGGFFCCCFLIKVGFLLHSSSFSVDNVNNVAVGPVQMPQRGKQKASQVYHLRQQIVSHSCLDVNSAINHHCSDCVPFPESKRGRTDKGKITRTKCSRSWERSGVPSLNVTYKISAVTLQFFDSLKIKKI